MNAVRLIYLLVLICASAGSSARTKKQKNIVARATDSIQTFIDSYENLGKTHFILGYTPETIPQSFKTVARSSTIESSEKFNFVTADGSVKQVFFTPDDHVQSKLVQLIKQEKKSIKITAYAFTNRDIAQELADGARRGLMIEMVVDPSVLQDAYSKIDAVLAEKISVFVYDPRLCSCPKTSCDPSKKEKKKNAFTRHVSLMHHKFIIFGSNVANKKLLWTGSCNLTNAALKHQQSNQENVVLTDDLAFIRRYEEHFEKLKQRSKPYDEIKSSAHMFMRR